MRVRGEQPVRVDGREEDARSGLLLREQEELASRERAREEGAGKTGSNRLIPCRDTPHTQYGG